MSERSGGQRVTTSSQSICKRSPSTTVGDEPADGRADGERGEGDRAEGEGVKEPVEGEGADGEALYALLLSDPGLLPGLVLIELREDEVEAVSRLR